MSDFNDYFSMHFDVLRDYYGEACSYSINGAAGISFVAVITGRSTQHDVEDAQKRDILEASAQFSADDVTGLTTPSPYRDTITDSYGVKYFVTGITKRRGSVFSVGLRAEVNQAFGENVTREY